MITYDLPFCGGVQKPWGYLQIIQVMDDHDLVLFPNHGFRRFGGGYHCLENPPNEWLSNLIDDDPWIFLGFPKSWGISKS